MATVIWTGPAHEHLNDIRRHVAEDSPTAALNLTRRILDASRRLELFPRSGRVVPDHEDEDLREIIVRPYRVMYRVTGDLVEILAVRHGARLLGDIPDL